MYAVAWNSFGEPIFSENGAKSAVINIDFQNTELRYFLQNIFEMIFFVESIFDVNFKKTYSVFVQHPLKTYTVHLYLRLAHRFVVLFSCCCHLLCTVSDGSPNRWIPFTLNQNLLAPYETTLHYGAFRLTLTGVIHELIPGSMFSLSFREFQLGKCPVFGGNFYQIFFF